MQLKEICQQYLNYRQFTKNFSPNTLKNDIHYLKRLNRCLGRIHVSQIGHPQVDKFREYLAKPGLNLALKTQNYHLITLRMLLVYAFNRDLSPFDGRKIELSKIPQKEVEFLTSEEVNKLFNSVNTYAVIGVRNMAILQTLYASGVRVSELTNLNWIDVDLKNKVFPVVRKGRKRGIAFLNSRAAFWIREYLLLRKDSSPALFVNYRCSGRTKGDLRRLSNSTVQRIVSAHAKKAELNKHVTCHTLRHSFATNMVMRGAPLTAVQEMLGHETIQSTMIYTHVTNPWLQKVYRHYHR